MPTDHGQCLACGTGRLQGRDMEARRIVSCSNAPSCKAGWTEKPGGDPEPKNYATAADFEAFRKRLRGLRRP